MVDKSLTTNGLETCHFLYKIPPIWMSAICLLNDDVIDKMAYVTVAAAVQKESVHWPTGWQAVQPLQNS